MDKINMIINFMGSLTDFKDCEKGTRSTREYMLVLSYRFKDLLVEMRDIVCLSPD